MKKPVSMRLADLPTPIEELNSLNPDPSHSNLYIKRDDYTGLEMSGNKVRKLEFVLKQALDEQADVFITCGGIQSNHCRATAAAAAKLSKRSHLVLKGEDTPPDGNHFLDLLFGATISFVSDEQYKNERNAIMAAHKDMYAKQGLKAYILPEGASNGLGMFGYFQAYEEILEQETQMGIAFDAICVANGSCGTYAGLYAANEYYNGGKRIVGFNIYSMDVDFQEKMGGILAEGARIGEMERPLPLDHLHIIHDYLGEGYGIASDEVKAFIKYAAKRAGIVLDPVYTGKGLFGVYSEIEKKNPLLKGNVLFIHTGGQFGLFPSRAKFL